MTGQRENPLAIIPWRPQRNSIHCMDALTFLACLPDASVDCVVTDPPYGLYGNIFVKRPDTGDKYNRVNELWDTEILVDWMADCQRVLKPGGSVICFGGRQSIYKLASEGLRLRWRLVNDITWHKLDAAPCFTGRNMTEATERALWFCPDGTGWTYNRLAAKSLNNGNNFRDVWEGYTTRGNRYHPTQKPDWIMERLIALLSNPGDLILDPFIGSGTTAVAAQKLGRSFLGCDISQDYVELAQRRVKNADPYQASEVAPGIAQLSLFSAEVA